MRAILGFLFIAWLGGGAFGGDASCERAALAAAEAHRVPVNLLMAMTQLESGRDLGRGFAPWPWTVGLSGVGHWAADAPAALRFARQALARGETNLDIGCFQLNLRWHGQAFSSLDAMFAPLRNADHAAKYLRDLYNELGDWELATGAWHSRTTRHAQAYLERLRPLLNAHAGQPQIALQTQPSLGSIMRTPSRARPLFGG